MDDKFIEVVMVFENLMIFTELMYLSFRISFYTNFSWVITISKNYLNGNSTLQKVGFEFVNIGLKKWK